MMPLNIPYQLTKGLTGADVDQALNKGKNLRTHVMRPTWHSVTLADIRWLLELTAPRVHAVNVHMYRKAEQDKTILWQTHHNPRRCLEPCHLLPRVG
jgi:hypothetical protein